MAGNSKDSKILAYKDMINQLNKTISAQTELIQSLQKTLEADRLEKENLRQQIEYLTKKLFGTSSEKRKDPRFQFHHNTVSQIQFHSNSRLCRSPTSLHSASDFE